ncbi:MAG TPA: ATP-binding protein [Paludibacteraceae bacterium]|nr:ATP-binding protein [Paludibacteraceae bacterium]
MLKIKFEYRITLAYLVIGSLWILFSDRLVDNFIDDKSLMTDMMTYKGWFYVMVTAALFFCFLKRHLYKLRKAEAELERHRNHLQELVVEKTRNLDLALKELNTTNLELSEKNDIINDQNAELKDALQHLKNTQSQLLQAEKMASLGILTAGVAHEINNPLNYILGGYTGLQNYFSENGIANERVSMLLENIKTGIDRSAAIVSGLNQFSRSRDKYDERCEIHSIIENCLVILNHQLKDRVEVIKDFTNEPFLLTGNVGKLHQVFLNILVNASQAIDERGRITIKTEKSGKWLHIDVSDTGSGISKENLPKITDPFFTTKDPGKGTGLGLSITFTIIREHKGSLEFESELNKGTTVRIKLPIN